MPRKTVVDKAREELTSILVNDWDSELVDDGIDLYSYSHENNTQTVSLIFCMETDVKYEFTFVNEKLLELVVVTFKWKKSYS